MVDAIELHDALVKEFTYEPDTGLFRRKIKRGGAPMKDDAKYGALFICGRSFSRHRMAWLYMTGELPDVVDHIDRNPANNRFSNLRASTHEQNMWNSCHPPGASGIRGVSIVGGRYRAKISKKGKSFHLGYFDSPEDAAARIYEALLLERGEFANTGVKS